MKANYILKCQSALLSIYSNWAFYRWAHKTIATTLPAWRPGRYQIADYIKISRSFFRNDTNDSTHFHLKSLKKIRWEISVPKSDNNPEWVQLLCRCGCGIYVGVDETYRFIWISWTVAWRASVPQLTWTPTVEAEFPVNETCFGLACPAYC
jgi:hypothetical protein